MLGRTYEESFLELRRGGSAEATTGPAGLSTPCPALIPATSTPAEAGRRGRNVAVGVLAGAAALAIIANSNRAHASDYSYGRRDGWRARCNRWYNRCQDGSDWACEKFETQGCSE